MIDTADNFVEQIKADMRAAMRLRDLVEAKTLQSLLATFSNAEAVHAPSNNAETSSKVAGASSGVGSTEVPRKNLTISELKGLVKVEIDELQHVIDQLDQSSAYRTELIHKATILQRYL